EELSDDLLDVSAGAKAAAFAGDDHDARRLARLERRHERAQLLVGVERERVELVGPIERERADSPLLGEAERARVHRGRIAWRSPCPRSTPPSRSSRSATAAGRSRSGSR